MPAEQECSCGHHAEVVVIFYDRASKEQWTFCSRACFQDWFRRMRELEKASNPEPKEG
jgi:hypothetical protein